MIRAKLDVMLRLLLVAGMPALLVPAHAAGLPAASASDSSRAGTWSG